MSRRVKEPGFNNELRMRHDNVGTYLLHSNGQREYFLSNALVHNTTSTTVSGHTAPRGSLARTIHATGRDAQWIAGATTWQQQTGGTLGQMVASVDVADQAARLALTGYARGAVVNQLDNGFLYMLNNAALPANAASWSPILKEYKATLRQDSPVLGRTSGLLTVGKFYVITDFIAGDNFTNVGGTNVDGNAFVATGTTPTVWSNSSVLDEYPAPTIMALKNTIGALTWVQEGGATFKVSGAVGILPEGKTYYNANAAFRNNVKSVNFGCWTPFENADENAVQLFLYDNDGVATPLDNDLVTVEIAVGP